MNYIVVEVFYLKKISIKGCKQLNGKTKIHGAKNAILPILSASVLADGNCILHNSPELSDVYNTIDILRFLGHNVDFCDNTLVVHNNNKFDGNIPDVFIRKMRSSILFMGALLNKYGYVKITLPGGCELGARPIDLHLKAFEQLGVKINEHYGYYECFCNSIIGNDVYLDFPSVGATENIMILACRCTGKTVIHNAAKEPEITDLQNFLNSMGADISGCGTNTIEINGVKELCGTEYTIMPDRIVTATYLIAAAITNSEIIITDTRSDDIVSVISVLNRCGFDVIHDKNTIKIYKNDYIKSVDLIRTMPYPGFPTDVQSILTPLLCLADGTSIITENLFENRFKHIGELNRMGADICVIERNAVIRGVDKLYGANVTATDLRSAAGLIIAGLAADGNTIVDGIEYLERGYDGFIENLSRLGAEISYTS